MLVTNERVLILSTARDDAKPSSVYVERNEVAIVDNTARTIDADGKRSAIWFPHGSQAPKVGRWYRVVLVEEE